MFEKEAAELIKTLGEHKDKWLVAALNTQGIKLSDNPTLDEFKEYKGRIELQMNMDIDPKCENLYVDGKLVGKWYQAEAVYGESTISFTNKYWIVEGGTIE